MPASDFLEKAILDHIFGKAAYTAPSNIYVALCTAAPNDASTGSTITEANYTSYARSQTAPSDWTAAVSPDGTIDNANAVEFPEATGGSSTVTHFALVDDASAGNVLLYGSLNSSLAVTTGIAPRFPAGQLEATAS